MRTAVRVRPCSWAGAVGGCRDGPRGPALLVAVRARAVDGRANAAVEAALAEVFEVRRADVGIVAGRSRDKVVAIRGDETHLRARLAVSAGRGHGRDRGLISAGVTPWCTAQPYCDARGDHLSGDHRHCDAVVGPTTPASRSR